MTAALFLSSTLPVSAVVIYTHSSSVPDRFNDNPTYPFPQGIHLFSLDGSTFDLDFNQDGNIDFILESTFSLETLRVIPQGGNAALAIPAPPPNLNSFTFPVDFAQTIGESPLGESIWLNSSSTMIGCQDIGCLGLFTERRRNYIGTQFDIAGEQHFGWIEIDIAAFLGGGVIISWAYESESGVPIIAGAIPIPEPSTYVSLILGLLALVSCIFYNFGYNRFSLIRAS